MRDLRVFARALRLKGTVLEGVYFDEHENAMVVSVRPRKSTRSRCGRCARRCPGYDRGGGRRRWRSLDVGTTRLFLEAEAPRVNCPEHGPTVIEVPWARHDARYSRDFEDTIAWLAVRCSKTAVSELMRVAWRSVGSILTRVQADLDTGHDRLKGLRRIGIDEISYKRGHRYLTVVIDHDTGALVWAAPGRDRATLRQFFDQLGSERGAQITHVSADAAEWVRHVVSERCPNAVLCLDPFHVVAWASEALDEVRRAVWNEARGGRPQHQVSRRRVANRQQAHPLRRVRFALWKNPENLTEHQREQLDWIATSHPRVWRAYLLKEGLRYVFKVKGAAGKDALDRWLKWTARSRLAGFVELGRRIRRHRRYIDATLEHGLTNGLIESTNTKIRLLTRTAFGFHSPQPLIALTILALGPHRPTLPAR